MHNPAQDEFKTVLFLCTGNYYRSRFAEHLFDRLAREEGLPWRAASRGLAAGTAGNIGPISSFALAELERRGIHLDGQARFPLQVTEADLDAADRIVAMKEIEHRAMLAASYPQWEDRVEYWHIDDLDCAGPEEALAAAATAVRALVRRLAEQRDAPGRG